MLPDACLVLKEFILSALFAGGNSLKVGGAVPNMALSAPVALAKLCAKVGAHCLVVCLPRLQTVKYALLCDLLVA